MLKIENLNSTEKNVYKRKIAIRKKFNELKKRHPKWRIDAIIEEISEKYYHFSERTILNAITYRWENKMIKKYGESIRG